MRDVISGCCSTTAGGAVASRLALTISGAYITISFYMLMPYIFMSLFTSDKKFFLAGARGGGGSC